MYRVFGVKIDHEVLIAASRRASTAKRRYEDNEQLFDAIRIQAPDGSTISESELARRATYKFYLIV